MSARERPGFSLGARLALLIFGVETILLAAFAVTVYYYAQSRFYASFDAMLQASAESVGTLLEDDEDAREIELEFSGEIMTRFTRAARPDLFAVLLEDGRVLEHSRSLATLPAFVRDSANRVAVRDFVHHGEAYRGILLNVARPSHERPRRTIRARVFFAASTHGLTGQLSSLAGILMALVAVGTAVSVALAGAVAWRGLSPLRRLARETAAIGDASLDRRLDTTHLPAEAHVLASATNALLDRVEAAVARERRFSSDAAHELRTPVATLKSGIQAALLCTNRSAGDRHLLESLLVDVVRLEELCDALLEVASARARPATGRITLNDWITEIDAVVRRLGPDGTAHADRLRVVRPDRVPADLALRTSAAATRRIATNLIENAVRHGGADAQVDVKIAVSADGAELVVQDNGPGVDGPDRSRLFERFFRADAARSRTTGGTGLGLAICRSLARAHGGDVHFEPVQPHGARFTWRAARTNGA